MEQEIIDWANTFDSTKSIDDLKTGVALCQIISRELFQDKRQCELKIRIIKCSKQDYQSCIRNLSFALQLIDESQTMPVKTLSGQMLYQNPLKIFQILTQLYRSKSVSSTSSKPPKAPQRQEEALFYVDENLVQPNQSQQTSSNDELVANKYKMIKPNSPYQEQSQQSQQQNRSQTHQTEFIESSTRSKQQIQTNESLTNITPIKVKEQYNYKLKQELQQLENQINIEQNSFKYSNKENPNKTIIKSDDTSLYQDNNKSQLQMFKFPQEQKLILVEWLKQIRLIKANAQGLENKLPKICKNGVIFFDLLNRLQGRDEVLKGALRNPKNQREIKHNYRRILDYLKQFEKINYRYLSSEQQLVDGDEDIFWGLLYDIKMFYNNSNTAAITGSQSVDSSVRQTQSQFCQQGTQSFLQNNYNQIQNQKNISNSKRKKRSSFNEQQLEIVIEPQQQQNIKQISRSPVGPYQKMHNQKAEYDSVNKSMNSLLKKSQVGSQSGTPVNQSLQQSRNFSSSKRKQRARSSSVSKNCVTREMELYVQTFFKQKGIYNNENLFCDPIRNGNFILSLVDQSLINNLNNNFRSILEVEFNVDASLQGVKAMVDAGSLPAWIGKINKQNIMQLDRQAMGLYWWLLKCQSTTKDQNIISFVLPYKQEDIEQLKLVTLHFIREFNPNVSNFNDLVYQCQTGILLCQIETQLLQTKITPIYTQPIGEKQCLANIRKALDHLKGKPLGQRFVWQEKEIYEGDQLVILGLFEDLRRFHDGLSFRQGDKYFEEGPYLNLFQLQNKSNNKLVDYLQSEPIQSKNVAAATQTSQMSSQVQIQQQINQQQPQQVSKRLIFDDPPQYEWLSQFGYKINWNNQILEEFKDGTILCQLIQKLENIEFKGVSYRPTTTAACLVNIKKVFNVLKDKIDMPLDLVIDQEKVQKGERQFILRLLNVIKMIYKHKIKSK